MKQTSFLSVGAKDWVKGLLVSVLTVIVTGVSTSLNAGSLPDRATLLHLIYMGAGAGAAYILKNFLTNSQDQFAKPEPKP